MSVTPSLLLSHSQRSCNNALFRDIDTAHLLMHTSKALSIDDTSLNKHFPSPSTSSNSVANEHESFSIPSSPMSPPYNSDALIKVHHSNSELYETKSGQEIEPFFQIADYDVEAQTPARSSEGSRTCESGNSNGYQIRVIGAPGKSRVETQIRLCIQLLKADGTKVPSWPYIKLPDRLLSRSRLKKTVQKVSADGGRMMLSDESKLLYLDAKVVCASKPDHCVKMCDGCIQRERKRAERSKNAGKPTEQRILSVIDDVPEEERVLLFNCGPYVNFSSGDAILPTRITCYCRHHSEKIGFYIHFELRDAQGSIVGIGDSPPILITDDHKSTQKKRSRSQDEGACTLFSKRSAPITPTASRRGSFSSAADEGSKPNTPLCSACDDVVTQAFMDPVTCPAFPSILDSCLPTPGEEQPDILAATEHQQVTTAFNPLFTAAAPPFRHPLSDGDVRSHIPQLERLVPSQGPTYGGTEVTILGSGFHSGLTCLFGEHLATTVYWSPNTLVCILPPMTHPGPVVVSFKEHPIILDGQDVPLFTYYDVNDQALLELALQVVGMKTTGKLQDAKTVAMNIVQGDNAYATMSSTNINAYHQQYREHQQHINNSNNSISNHGSICSNNSKNSSSSNNNNNNNNNNSSSSSSSSNCSSSSSNSTSDLDMASPFPWKHHQNQ